MFAFLKVGVSASGDRTRFPGVVEYGGDEPRATCHAMMFWLLWKMKKG